MCSRIVTRRSTPDCSAEIERLRAALERADAVVIGAGSGLSASAGFAYSGARFERYFSDFDAEYGFSRHVHRRLLSRIRSLEEYWAYWSRYIFVNRYHGRAAAGLRGSAGAGAGTRTISCSPPTWTTASRRRASIRSACFTRRGITACSSAARRAVRRHGTMKRSSAKW